MCCHSYIPRPQITKDEKIREAREITRAIPTRPSEEIMTDFRAVPYDSIEAVYKSEFTDDPETGKKVKQVGVRCGFCGEKQYYPYHPLFRGQAIAPGYRHDNYCLEDEGGLKSSGQQIFCPSCFRRSTLISYTRAKDHAIGEVSRFVIQVANICGHMVIIHWRLDKWIDRHGNESVGFELRNASFNVAGKMFRAVGYDNWYGNRIPLGNWWLCEQFKPNIPGILVGSTYWHDEDLVGAEEYNDGLKKYLHAVCPGHARTLWLERYLMVWSKHRNFENIVKTLNIEYTDALLAQRLSWQHSINVYAETIIEFKQVRPHRMLSLEKEDMKRLIGKRFTPEKIAVLRNLDSRSIAAVEDLLSDAPNEKVKDFLDLMDGDEAKAISPPFLKTLHYVLHGMPTGFNSRYLCDYWRMTKETEGDVSPELLFPKDLRAAHDRATAKYEAAKNKKTDNAIRKNVAKVAEYSYCDKETGLFIRPAESVADLVLEGKHLHHCVASYASKVAAGRTLIFFIRHIDSPDDSFFTLEYSENRVIQNRGMKNCDRTPEVVIFEAKWLKHIEQIKKGTKKNGKRTDTKQSAGKRAGA